MLKNGDIIPLTRDKYKIIEHLDQGSFGVVWKARRLSDGHSVALKTAQEYRSQKTQEKVIEKLDDEIAFLKRITPEEADLHHIIPLLDWGRYEDRPVMVMLLCDRNMGDICDDRFERKKSPFDGRKLLVWIRQIATALQKVHTSDPDEKWTALRDLKFDNILFKADMLYLADFGTVKPISNIETKSAAFTEGWAAPEMIIPSGFDDKNEPQYRLTHKVDLYSLGLMVYALATNAATQAQKQLGKYPIVSLEFGSVGGLTKQEIQLLHDALVPLFDTASIGGTMIADGESDPDSLPDYDGIAKELCVLTGNMLAPLAEDRPDAADVIQKTKLLAILLSPSVDALDIHLPAEWTVGKPCRGTVAVSGNGLTSSGKWLYLRINDEPTETAFRYLKGRKNQWEFRLPAFDKEGTFEIQVFALIFDEPVRAFHGLTVSATAEQLWDLGRRADALVKTPDQVAWLNELEEKAAESRDSQRAYRKILETVREAHPDREGRADPKMIEVNRRYFTLLAEMAEEKKRAVQEADTPVQPDTKPDNGEEENPEIKPVFPLRKILAALLCLLVAGFGIWRIIDRDSGLEEAMATYHEILKAAESGDREKAGRLISGNRDLIRKLKNREADNLDLLETFFELSGRADKALLKAESEADLKSVRSDLVKAGEIEDQLSGVVALEGGIAEKLKAVDGKLAALKEVAPPQLEPPVIVAPPPEPEPDPEELAKAAAEKNWGTLLSFIRDGKWNDALPVFNAHQEDFRQYLTDSRKAVDSLPEFFRKVEIAEKLSSQSRMPEELYAAKSAWEDVKTVAAFFPEAAKIAEEHMNQMARAAWKEKVRLAEKAYAEIVDLSNRKRWPKAAEKLADKDDMKFLTDHLDREKAGYVIQLEIFFGLIGDAGKAEKETPETPETLDKAMGFLSEAYDVAMHELPDEIKLASNVRKDRKALSDRRDRLVRVQKEKEAEAAYAKVMETAKAGRHPDAERLISGSSGLWSYLESGKQGHLNDLKAVYTLTAQADRALKKPKNVPNLEAAVDALEKTRKAIAKLSGIVYFDPEGLSKKLASAAAKLDELKQKEEEDSVETYTKTPLVKVPAGKFLMGSNKYDDEKPPHEVYLDEYYIEKYEVSAAQFAAFLNARGNSGNKYADVNCDRCTLMQENGSFFARKGYEDRPANNVSWYGADSYCKWIGRRLPTEAQWEKAARGTDGRTYPWGEGIDKAHAVYSSSWTHMKPVTSLPAGKSPYGAHHMAGNVWEWVADWYDSAYYGKGENKNPTGPRNKNLRVLRGGSWHHFANYVRSAYRNYNYPRYRNGSNGCRCASPSK